MNDNLHLKIALHGENGLSMTHLDIDRNQINYNRLRESLENLLDIPPHSTISINCYNGKERIAVENDADLKKLLYNYRRSISNLTVYVTLNSEEINSNDNQDLAHKVTHHSVLCDNCHCVIIGNRFNCLECVDFDLCNLCFSRNVHSNGHSLIVMRSNILSPIVHKMVTTCHRELQYLKQQTKSSQLFTKVIRRRYSETPLFIDNRYSSSPKERSTLNGNIEY